MTTSTFATIRDIIPDVPTVDMRAEPILTAVRSGINSANVDDSDQKASKLTADSTFTARSFYRFLIDRGLRFSVAHVIFKCFIPRKIAVLAGWSGTKRSLCLMPFSPGDATISLRRPVFCVALRLSRLITFSCAL